MIDEKRRRKINDMRNRKLTAKLFEKNVFINNNYLLSMFFLVIDKCCIL